ncbi:hypothetical protein [Streptomyces huasconensis]|uniref:hypothetical protein n=1 Tax=Streptomyces huasconensis TaxID=1854574 RepID=UPI0036F74A0C
MTCAPDRTHGRAGAAIAVMLGIFVIVTTEILPIGPLASDGFSFTVSNGTAGLR